MTEKSCENCTHNIGKEKDMWYAVCSVNDSANCWLNESWRSWNRPIEIINLLKKDDDRLSEEEAEKKLQESEIITCKKCGLNYYYGEYNNFKYCKDCDKK